MRKPAVTNRTTAPAVKLRKGLWSPEEDDKLMRYMLSSRKGCWRDIARNAGLQRCGKSCRLRWINYLRPDLKRGAFTPHEEELIMRLHSLLGNRWSQIAARLPGRTDNEIKNFWNSTIKKRLKRPSKPSPGNDDEQQENTEDMEGGGGGGVALPINGSETTALFIDSPSSGSPFGLGGGGFYGNHATVPGIPGFTREGGCDLQLLVPPLETIGFEEITNYTSGHANGRNHVDMANTNGGGGGGGGGGDDGDNGNNVSGEDGIMKRGCWEGENMTVGDWVDLGELMEDVSSFPFLNLQVE